MEEEEEAELFKAMEEVKRWHYETTSSFCCCGIDMNSGIYETIFRFGFRAGRGWEMKH